MNVLIDDKFARFGAKSYAINKINSVEVRRRRPHGQGAAYFWGLLALIFGIGALNKFSDLNGNGFVGLIIAALCGWLAYKSYLKSQIEEFDLFLMTSSSEAQAFTTRDASQVENLRDRIERAMAASA